MPSTYSNIKIQLMATGENNTTWGNVTNINLGTALEEAIVGSADVTFASGNVTLTLTDTNASQSARHMRLRCTGVTGGSTRDLIVPAIEKPYIIQNDCLNSIVVKNATGTGITVPAGKTMWVYNNGTNVVDAVNHLSSLTLGTDLTVADGGTGASTFTANGVIYGNTTSPLLATAAGTTGQVLVGNTGGAPSWATLTGIGVTSFSGGTTGLTPASPTTGAITLAGTLGVANGGTGTATAFTAGSVVFAGASGVYSQDNTNFFWDDTNNRLGIGTATPGARLETSVTSAGATAEVLRLSNPGAGANTQAQINFSTTSTSYATITGGYGAAAPQMTFNLPSATAGNYIWQITGTERMRIDAAGNVQVGGTGESQKLNVITNTGTSGMEQSFGITNKVDSNLFIQVSGTANTDKKATIGPSTSTSLVFNTNSIERMRIAAGGNVGIGTSSPDSILQVVASGLTSMRLGYNNTSENYYDADTQIFRSINGTERMRIASTGFVGIGTSAPAQKLHTFIAAGNVSNLIESGSNTSVAVSTIYKTANRSWEIGQSPGIGDNSFTIYDLTSAAVRLTINTSGNVGIGTSSPSYPLEVRQDGASTATYIGSVNTTATGGSGAAGYLARAGSNFAYFYVRGDGTAYIDNATANPLGFAVNGTERMRINSTGNVGIGTASPTANLEVFSSPGGEIRFGNVSGTGRLIANGTATYIGSYSNHPVVFQTDQVEKMRITSAGDVGIGTSSPGATLAVTGGLDGIYNANVLVSSSASSAKLAFNPNGVSSAGIGSASGGLIFYASGANTERARFDASGNLLVGTTTAAQKLTVAGNVQLTSDYPDVRLLTSSGYGWRVAADSNGTNTGKLYLQSTANSFSAANSVMVMDSNGNVGINTVTPEAKLDVLGTSSDQIRVRTAGTEFYRLGRNSSSGFMDFYGSQTGYTGYTFGGVDGERARIDSSGNLLVGTTDSGVSSGAGIKLNPNYGGNGVPNVGVVTVASTGTTTSYSAYSTGAAAYRFYVDNAGNIFATNTSISAISDQRLKENVRDLDAGLDTILALKPRRFDWKAGKGKDVRDDMGFIAQEVEEVLPALIGGWKAGEGEPDDLKSVKAGDLIPVLVKAIQELTARVAQLEGK